MKLRRRYLVLAAVGALLLMLDGVQRWVYVHRAPAIAQEWSQGEGTGLTDVIMAAGVISAL